MLWDSFDMGNAPASVETELDLAFRSLSRYCKWGDNIHVDSTNAIAVIGRVSEATWLLNDEVGKLIAYFYYNEQNDQNPCGDVLSNGLLEAQEFIDTLFSDFSEIDFDDNDDPRTFRIAFRSDTRVQFRFDADEEGYFHFSDMKIEDRSCYDKVNWFNGFKPSED